MDLEGAASPAMRGLRLVCIAVVFAACPLAAGEAAAQELEPRLYSNTPVDLHFLALAYGYSTGNVLLDPTLPVEDVEARVNTGALQYLYTFRVFGRASKIDLVVPHSWGHWEGLVDGEAAQTGRTGFGDPRIRFAVNFVGSPALDLQEFRKFRQKWIVGASLQVILPLGEYDSSDLINLGSNRWTFRPQIGFSRAVKNWIFELTGTAWLFTDNDEVLPDMTLKQEPVYAVQGHVIYTFRPGLWLGVDAGFANGGRTRVDGEVTGELQANSRAGMTLSLPLGSRDGLKLAYARGVSTRIGADFDNLLVAWQHMWGGGGAPKR